MAHSHSDTAILTLEKSFTYRGVREHWSNAYHLDSVPATSADWATLQGTAWALEAAMLTSNVQLEAVYGHEPGTPPVLVYEADIPPAGEGGIAGAWVPGLNDWPQAGDAAMWMRYGTTQKTSLGKPIYLRNYYHGVYTGGTHDAVSPTQLAALNALGAAWVQGIAGSGSTIFHRAGPRGAVAQNHLAGAYATTRTLKHRGKRKSGFPTGSTVQVPPIIID